MMNRQKLKQKLRQASQLCSKRNARFTRLRRRVFLIILDTEKPVSAYQILKKIPDKSWSSTPPTVYRAIDFLLQQQLIHKIESLHAYVGCNHPEEPHHSQFLVCTDCGIANEMELSKLSSYLHSTESLTSFQVHRPVIELLGTCAECK